MGKVWATKRHPSLPVGAYVLLQMGPDETLVALDGLGAGLGDEALVVTGSIAAGICGGMVDAVVIGIVDPVQEQV